MSHTWGRPFNEMLAHIKEHFSEKQQRAWRSGKPPLDPKETFLWIDLFAVGTVGSLAWVMEGMVSGGIMEGGNQ